MITGMLKLRAVGSNSRTALGHPWLPTINHLIGRARLRFLSRASASATAIDLPAAHGATDAELARLSRRRHWRSPEEVRWDTFAAARYGLVRPR